MNAKTMNAGTMNRTDHPTALEQALSEECASAREFHELLERERKALTDGDLEQVFTLANEKLELATRLRKQADRRESLFVVLGNLPGSADPVSQWPHLAQRWQGLLDLLAKAGEANRINGLIVNSRLGAIGNAIAALRGTANDPALYGRDGSTAAGFAGVSARWAA